MDELIRAVMRAQLTTEKHAQAAIAAIRETHAIVPREPTEAMKREISPFNYGILLKAAERGQG